MYLCIRNKCCTCLFSVSLVPVRLWSVATGLSTFPGRESICIRLRIAQTGEPNLWWRRATEYQTDIIRV